jgi:transcriptional regulator with XRE-family HTH domain
VSLAELADVVGVHRSHIGRIEANEVRPSLRVLAAIGVALGADLGVRFYTGAGPRLHDRFQALMVEHILKRLDPRWTPELEAPIARPSRGVIDIVLRDRSTPIVVAAEVQSELRRLEEQIRWSAEKADGLRERLERDRPGVTVSRLLLIRSTSATREIARRYASTLATAYPARTESVVQALTQPSTPWPGAGIGWIRIDGDVVSLLMHPPRGVDLGR